MCVCAHVCVCVFVHVCVCMFVHMCVIVVYTELWISPGIKGDTPPPCAEFTFTIVGEDLAVMFGGYQPIRRIYSTDLYVLNLSSLVSLHK